MPSNRFTRVASAERKPDGTGVQLVIETESDHLTVEFDAATLQQFLTHLMEVAVDAARLRTRGQGAPFATGDSLNLDCFPITDIAVGMTKQQGLVLYLRVFDFDLGYTLGTQHLRSIANSFQEMVKALEADEGTSH